MVRITQFANSEKHCSESIFGNSFHYPFGMLMPERSYSSPSYRYGFNGQEKNDEINGEGSEYSFGARDCDVRLGRWLSIDPLSLNYPWASPYISMSNDPINRIDPDGMGDYYTKDGKHLANDGKTVDKNGKKVDDDMAYIATQETIDKYTKDGVTDWDKVIADNTVTQLSVTNTQLIEGAAVAYNEGETTFEGRNAIVNVILRRMSNNKASFDVVMAGLSGVKSNATHANRMTYYLFGRYQAFFNAGNDGRNKDEAMMGCIAAAISAMNGGKDYSNGATYWHGNDFFNSDGQPLNVNAKGKTTYGKFTTRLKDAKGNQVYGICWYAYEAEYLTKGFRWDDKAIISGKGNPYLNKPFTRKGTKSMSYYYIGVASYGKNQNVFMKTE